MIPNSGTNVMSTPASKNCVSFKFCFDKVWISCYSQYLARKNVEQPSLFELL